MHPFRNRRHLVASAILAVAVLQCATARVPLDYDQADGQQISLALIRRPATDHQHRIGSLFINNGGPGNSVLDFVRGDATEVLSPEVRARFDVVGFDPRGVGQSTPVQCFTDLDQQGEFFGSRPALPVGADEVRAFTKGSKALGLTYANLFPGRVQALLLDGTPDAVEWTRTDQAAKKVPFAVRLDSADATSTALGFFLDSCQAAGDVCAFAAPATRAKFGTLNAIAAYLIRAQTPAAGAVCQPDQQPFEAGDQP